MEKNEIMHGNLAELTGIARLLAASGYFDAKGASEMAIAQVATKIMAGREMGLGPFAAVQGIHVISGRPALSANLIAAAIKSSPKYDYRVLELTAEACEIEIFERVGGKLESLGKSRFTADDAQSAGTQNMKKFARNMLFARAISNAARWYCPDLFSGNAVYVPEELGAVVDGEGNVIELPAAPKQLASAPAAPSAPASAPAAPASAPVAPAAPIDMSDVPAEVSFWSSPNDAYDWAVGIGASENAHAARAAFKRLVDNQFGGKLTAENKIPALSAFHADRMAKLSAASIDMATATELPH
jgi:hypothetical protein